MVRPFPITRGHANFGSPHPHTPASLCGSPSALHPPALSCLQPPYFSKGPRPAITGAPTSTYTGQQVTVTYSHSGNDPVDRAILIRTGAVTHSQAFGEPLSWAAACLVGSLLGRQLAWSVACLVGSCLCCSELVILPAVVQMVAVFWETRLSRLKSSTRCCLLPPPPGPPRRCALCVAAGREPHPWPAGAADAVQPQHCAPGHVSHGPGLSVAALLALHAGGRTPAAMPGAGRGRVIYRLLIIG